MSKSFGSKRGRRPFRNNQRGRNRGGSSTDCQHSELPQSVEVTVRDLAHDGRGVARVEQRTVFIAGALSGEKVQFRYLRRRGKFDEAVVEQIIEPSPQRVEPSCPHFFRCGGCQLQHLATEAQIDYKQQLLLRTLERIGRVQPEQIMAPIVDQPWGYRRRARLAVRYLARENRVELGFREADSERIAPLSQCPVLMPPFDQLFAPLAELLGGLQACKRIPQIELLAADNGNALNIHLLTRLSDTDRNRLQDFANSRQLHIYLQSSGVESVAPLIAGSQPLSYRLHEFDLNMAFLPGSFLQVNPQVNRQLVQRAVELLALNGTEKVLDLFCGIGNFTLPVARCAGRVIGVEGSGRAIDMAIKNAQLNQLTNTEFYVADLTGTHSRQWAEQQYDAVLLDPPRSGAAAVIPLVGRSGARRVVYVSCHPGSLARDVGELVKEYGYRLVSVGAVEMFPHTAHLESIVLLEKG